jgi:hypothetical protein
VISGKAETLDRGEQLEGGLVRLVLPTGELVEEQPLRADQTFAFTEVDLRPDSLNEFGLEVIDRGGNPVAMLSRVIVHAADHKETVGRAMSTSVLSKAILLEGTDGERVVRTILLPEGTSLPARAQYLFALGDSGGQIRLPIYQENRIIKELSASVGKVPVGTPVNVEIACDEQVHIQVRFSVGETEYGGHIEPPPPETTPTEHDVERIDYEFREALESLEKQDGEGLRLAYDRARADLDEARRGADYPKVIQRAADLQGLIRDARLAEPLRPPLEAVETQAQSCLELLPHAEEVRPDIKKSSLRADLERALERARDAYRRRDRSGYSDMVQIVSATLQYLVSVKRVDMGNAGDVSVAVRAVTALEQARQMMQGVFLSCLVTDHATFLPPVIQYIEELNGLDERVSDEPVEVLNRCQVLMTEARRIYTDNGYLLHE